MKKFFYLVVLAIAAIACDNTIKTPIDETGLFVVCEKGTPIYGVVDSQDNVILPMMYNNIGLDPAQRLLIVTDQDNFQYLYNFKGNSLFGAVTLTKRGQVWLGKTGEKVAMYDPSRNLTTEHYDNIVVGINQILVTNENQHAVLDRNAKELIPWTEGEILVVNDENDYYYAVQDTVKHVWMKYDKEGKKTKKVYTAKKFDTMKSAAVSTWAGGFSVKKIQ